MKTDYKPRLRCDWHRLEPTSDWKVTMKRITGEWGAEDVLILIGLVMLAAGLWMFSPALALTITGAVLTALGLYLAGR